LSYENKHNSDSFKGLALTDTLWTAM